MTFHIYVISLRNMIVPAVNGCELIVVTFVSKTEEIEEHPQAWIYTLEHM